MTSEEYLDNLLQSLEENTDKEEESSLIKKIFTDLDDYEKKEDMSSFDDAISVEEMFPDELQIPTDEDTLPSGNEILMDDAFLSENQILPDDELPGGNEILSDGVDSFDEEEWKASLDELLAAADESGMVSEADLEKVSVDDMDVTQYIDSMEELDDSLVEINELLKKSDNNETIEMDDMQAFLNSMNGESSADDILDDTDMMDVQSQSEDDAEPKKKKISLFGKNKKEGKVKPYEKQKKAKKKKNVEEMHEEADAPNEAVEEVVDADPFQADNTILETPTKKKSAGNNQGFLSRLFEALTAEAEEDDQPEGLSENDEILKELENEDLEKSGKKDKKKKDKKEKKTKVAEDAPKEKKQKPKKEKTSKEPVEKEKSQKVLSRKAFITLIAFCASLVAAIVALSFFLTDYADKKKAREAFYMGDYHEVYLLLHDKTLSDSDALILERVRVILELERNIKVYEFYVKTENEAMAINALLEGVKNYGEISEKNNFGSGRELENIYQDILQILEEKYGISEEEAKEINTYNSEDYTRRVYGIVNGTDEAADSDSEQEETQNIQDILPEEEGIIELETENEGA